LLNFLNYCDVCVNPTPIVFFFSSGPSRHHLLVFSFRIFFLFAVCFVCRFKRKKENIFPPSCFVICVLMDLLNLFFLCVLMFLPKFCQDKKMNENVLMIRK
jgi:predicted transporter